MSALMFWENLPYFLSFFNEVKLTQTAVTRALIIKFRSLFPNQTKKSPKLKTTKEINILFLFGILCAFYVCVVFGFNWNSVPAQFKRRVDVSQRTAAAALLERCGCLTKKNVPLLFIAHHCYLFPFYCSGKDSRLFCVQTQCPGQSSAAHTSPNHIPLQLRLLTFTLSTDATDFRKHVLTKAYH